MGLVSSLDDYCWLVGANLDAGMNKKEIRVYEHYTIETTLGGEEVDVLDKRITSGFCSICLERKKYNGIHVTHFTFIENKAICWDCNNKIGG